MCATPWRPVLHALLFHREQSWLDQQAYEVNELGLQADAYREILARHFEIELLESNEMNCIRGIKYR